ncbi:GcvT family protein [Symbioplanes lichenis]|uniref:GcvT family protein n=1 Tax=Symbioplanes lichenis TaxID=1629072 RepID=UPI0027388894|nr:FAD-dependent oxidoreductase [Actinoplanes lichenis]
MRIVVVGAGIVGCALADELTRRGATDVTVLDQGDLADTGGSSFHAPGLAFRTNPSRMMASLAQYTVAKYTALGCFDPVGSLEVATTPARLRELHRRHGFAESWGIPSRVIGPAECVERYPLLHAGIPAPGGGRTPAVPAAGGLSHGRAFPQADGGGALGLPQGGGVVLGGLLVPGDGLVRAAAACEVQAGLAIERGAKFVGHQRVVAVDQAGGRVTGVRTDDTFYPADVVVSCAGFWGPIVGRLAGVPVPLQPMAHQYVRTSAVASPPATILRHQDRDLYFRSHGDHLGIGSYLHRPLPVDPAAVPGSILPFTPDDFAESWDAARTLLPALHDATVAHGFNGVFSFTPDGFPLLGESRTLRGFWTAEAVWVTHSAGAARAVAEWIVDGRPGADVHEGDLRRFTNAQTSPSYVRERAIRSFVEVYDIVHPQDPPSVRGLRTSPFHDRQAALGAVFGEAAGWERPLWYEPPGAGADRQHEPHTADADREHQPHAADADREHEPHAADADRGHEPRDAGGDLELDEWSARHWSPAAATEARATVEAVALYDMSPLTRLEVTGPVSFLEGLTSGDVDRPVGSVTYTLLLDDAGGIRSDITVARLGPELFQVGVNGPLDTAYLASLAPPGVSVRDVTGGTCGVGLWGPNARELMTPLTELDVTHEGFGYFRCRQGHVGDVPVTMLRVSYVGELGWEIYTGADLGRRLWDTLWAAGAGHGLVAAGRAAFQSLRLEKGYRAWGADMTTEHDPYEAGLGFAVRPDKGDFPGRAALLAKPPPARCLVPLVLADRAVVPLGGEPVYAGGTAVGHVTSGAYGHTVGAPIAYAWVPAALATPGTAVRVGWFDRRIHATVGADPLVAATGARGRQ